MLSYRPRDYVVPLTFAFHLQELCRAGCALSHTEVVFTRRSVSMNLNEWEFAPVFSDTCLAAGECCTSCTKETFSGQRNGWKPKDTVSHKCSSLANSNRVVWWLEKANPSTLQPCRLPIFFLFLISCTYSSSLQISCLSSERNYFPCTPKMNSFCLWLLVLFSFRSWTWLWERFCWHHGLNQQWDTKFSPFLEVNMCLHLCLSLNQEDTFWRWSSAFVHLPCFTSHWWAQTMQIMPILYGAKPENVPEEYT